LFLLSLPSTSVEVTCYNKVRERKRERGTTRRALLSIDFAVTPKNGQYSWHCYRVGVGEREKRRNF